MKNKRFHLLDPVLVTCIVLLLIIGSVMVYSSSSFMAQEKFSSHTYYLKRHLFLLGVGWIALFAALVTPLRWLKKITLPVILAVTALLLVVIFTSMGVEAKHATRWISLGPFRFQPSEMIKPWLILFTAGYLERIGPKIKDFKNGLMPILLMNGIVLLCILKQPDFGTAVTIAAVLFLMFFVAGARWHHLVGLASLGMMAGSFLIYSADYRRKRLFSFLNPWADPRGDGFQMVQSFIAFERGGVVGQGLGDGTQKLLYLPEAHTDFIFSVIGEELGFLGCAIVVILFFIIMVQGIRLAIRIQDPFASLLTFGLTSMITLQSLFNMGVVTGLLPTKGLTLPLVSYGGSSLIATMFSLGMLLSLSSIMANQKTKIGRVL